MAIESVVFLLAQSEFFADGMTPDMVRHYLTRLVTGLEAPSVGAKGKRCNTEGVNYLQLASLMHWVATHRAMTYAETVSKLVPMRSVGAGLRRMFDSFATGRAKRMTVADFTRFCSKFNLFAPKVLTPGDVWLLFRDAGEKTSLDFNSYKRVLSKVAAALGIERTLFATALVVYADGHRTALGCVDTRGAV